ncbi:MAG: MoxR family ATPase [Desulfobacterales bacterium]|nr:MoxR family ATPase [Desulfobacterales bacterium]
MEHLVQARIKHNNHDRARYPFVGKVISDKNLQKKGPLFCNRHNLLESLKNDSSEDFIVKVLNIEEKAVIGEIIERLPKVPDTLKLICPQLVYRQLYHAFFNLNYNILFVGPHGSGKTTTSRLLAEAFGMQFEYFSCAGIMEPQDFFAKLELHEKNGHSFTFYRPTRLREIFIPKVQNDKSVLVMLDEINRCSEVAQNALFSLLDKTKVFYDPITEKLQPVPVNVKFIAAANIGRYSGTFRLDNAILDRFLTIELSYPSQEAESEFLSSSFPEVPNKFIELLTKFADSIRQDPLLTPISLRITRQITEQVNLCLDLFNGSQEPQNWSPELVKIIINTASGRLYGAGSAKSNEADILKERLMLYFESVI